LVDHNVTQVLNRKKWKLAISTQSLITDLLLSYDTLMTDLRLASDF